MLKKLSFIVALLLLSGLVYAANPSATLSVQVVPAVGPSNGCTGASPDPQAATDGFTSPAFCIDFTQATLPANWLLCPALTDTPGYLLYAGWEFGSGFPGCQYITHEIDPTTGRMALHLAYPASLFPSEDTTNAGLEVISAPNENATNGNFFGLGWHQITYRIETTPAAPAPQYVNPGVNYSFYDGTGHIEFDVHEYFALFPNCPDMNILDHDGGNGGFLFDASPCPNSSRNPNQYQTWATRVTGNGSTTQGYTGYIDGSVVGGFTRGYGPLADHSGAFQVWNSPFSCSYGAGPCSNASITAAFQCGGLTCVTLSKAVYVGTGAPTPNCGQGANAFIQGASGIAGLNGVHQPCASDNANPSTNFTLTDLPWPGGSYSGGGQWNPLTRADVWVESIQVWTCPSWNPSFKTHSLSECSSTPLSGAP